MHRASELQGPEWRVLSESQVKSLTTVLFDPPFASPGRAESRAESCRESRLAAT